MLKYLCSPTDFNLWAGGGKYSCFLGAERKSSFSDVNGFVSQLLNICLQMGRPLRHYGCTFYLPLDLFLEEDLAKSQEKLDIPVAETVERHRLDVEISIIEEELYSTEGLEKQAYLYFLPHLRDMVFDVKDSKNKLGIEAIERWKLNDEMIMQLGTDNPIIVNLTDVSLYRYFNDTYML